MADTYKIQDIGLSQEEHYATGLRKVSEFTGINYETLAYHFSPSKKNRKKRVFDDKYLITKIETL